MKNDMTFEESKQVLDRITDEICGILDAASELEASLNDAQESLFSDDYDTEDEDDRGLALISMEACELALGHAMSVRSLLRELEA